MLCLKIICSYKYTVVCGKFTIEINQFEALSSCVVNEKSSPTILI